MPLVMNNIDDATLEWMQSTRSDVSHLDPERLCIKYEELVERGETGGKTMREWLDFITDTNWKEQK